jgi:hypothetical protein
MTNYEYEYEYELMCSYWDMIDNFITKGGL